MSTGTLRVIDFGRVSPLRSQTLWHAIAHGVSAGAPPTLSLMQPDAPYVSIGYHRRLAEVDQEECRRSGLPIFRRMVGGGPVYLDDGQLFFQITVPVADVPAVRARAVRGLLQPAVEAFRAAGVDAEIEEAGDVVVGDRKVCGHAAGQIEQAVVVVGNLITSFDHAAAARIVATPNDDTRVELEALMRRYVVATPADHETFKSAAVQSYAGALGLKPEESTLASLEEDALEAIDTDFIEDDWLRGVGRPSPSMWRVKVKAGVFLVQAAVEDTSVLVSLASGRIIRSQLHDPVLDRVAPRLEHAVAGRTLAEARSVLVAAGCGRLAGLLEDIDRAA